MHNWFSDIGAIFGWLAAMIVAAGIILKPIDRFADKVADRLEARFHERVIAVIRTPAVAAIIQEEVASEMGVVIESIADLHATVTDEVMPRLDALERGQATMLGRQTRRRSGDSSR